MLNKGMFTSNTDLWATPQELFDSLNAEFDFALDVCALPENAKVPSFFTPEIDGLKQDWNLGWCWMNPPYGREIGKWVAKASQYNCVCLLPARTDTRWFHDYIYHKAEIRFLKGRIKFGNAKSGAPFPSMVVVFRK